MSLSSALLLSLQVSTARAFRGGRGECVWVVSCERGVDEDHPQLRNLRPLVVGTEKDSTFDVMHGTMTAGVLSGDGPTVEGICPLSPLVFSSVPDSLVHIEILQAMQRMRFKPGDVFLLEAQIGDPPYFLPVEVHGPNREAIRQATAAGLVVVEAAGNGGHNIDGFTDAIQPETDAVMVGSTDLESSNRGKRIDVVGPGKDVPSLVPGGGTGTMTGTSSASAVTAGVCAVVNSILKAHDRPVLNSGQMRLLLRKHGLHLDAILRDLFGCMDYDGDGEVGFYDAIKALGKVKAASEVWRQYRMRWPEDYAR